MKKIFILIFFILFSLAIADVSPVFAAENRTINFNLSSSRTIPKNIHGVNQNWYKEYPIGTAYLTKGITDIRFTTIRFPGGTVGNYYDWASLSPDWEYIMSKPVPGFVKGSKIFYDANVKNLSAVDFIQTAKTMGKNVNILVNVLTNTPADIAGALQKIKDAGLQVQYMEMGNELYISNQNTENLSAPEYLARSRNIATEAKKVFPNIKIGVVGNKDLVFNNNKYPNWSIPNQPWFDGVVFHPYTGGGPGEIGSTEFINWINNQRAVVFNDFVTRFKLNYPGKELWLTEWNMWEQSEGEGEPQSVNTYAQSYYVYDVLLNMLRYPEITLADIHNVNSVILRVSDDVYRKKSPYWPLAWIGQAFSNYNRFTIGTNAQNDVTAVYFYNQNQPNNGSLSLINKNNSPIKISLTGISLSGQQLKLATLAKPWDKKSTEANEFNPTTTNVTANSIIIPGYAIAYLSAQSGSSPTPTPNPNIINGIEYLNINGQSLKLNICKPEGVNSGKLPTVVYIHGGGFKGLDRNAGFAGYCDFFSSNGYILASVDYRLAPTYPYPAALDDVQYAIRWLKKHAGEYNIDPEKIASFGTSAGATLASLLGVRDTKNPSLGLNEQSSRVKAVISFYGVQDFTNTSLLGTFNPLSYFFLDNADLIRDGSPITHATADDAPFLFVHGTSDTTVLPIQSQRMQNRLNSLSVPNKLVTFEGGHGGGLNEENVKNNILDFLRQYLQGAAILPGDLDGNGKVNYADWEILKGDFGKTGTTAGWIKSDIIKNGKVDLFDYNILVGNFGQ